MHVKLPGCFFWHSNSRLRASAAGVPLKIRHTLPREHEQAWRIEIVIALYCYESSVVNHGEKRGTLCEGTIVFWGRDAHQMDQYPTCPEASLSLGCSCLSA